MEYFIIDKNGQQAGPFSLAQLIQQGITPDTLVWKQGMKDWTPAWQVEDLKGNIPPTYQPNAQTTEGQPYAGQQFTGQQPTGQQPYASQEPPRKSNKLWWKILLGVIVLILLVLTFTNPSEETHRKTVRTEVGEAIEKATATTDNNFFTQGIRAVAKMMAGNFLDAAFDELFEYHNYVLFSKGTVNLNGKEHPVSFGILGKVYTMNSDDMINALEKEDNLKIMESQSSTSSDEPSSDETTTDESSDNQSDGSSTNGMQQRLEDKANQTIDRISDKVSKKIEEKINEKLDEATDSSTLEKLIERIGALF